MALLGLTAVAAYVPRGAPAALDEPSDGDAPAALGPGDPAMERVRFLVEARLEADRETLERFRPGYSFWRHIYTIPDGHVAFGSALDGSLLATFPRWGDWRTEGVWEEPSHAALLERRSLPRGPGERRARMAELLEAAVGPVIHNATRGEFFRPNAERYGDLAQEWGAIYRRFGVPPELGLAQALLESGWGGTRRSEAGAVGLCQWLPFNWRRLQRHSPAVIEVGNSTTQAAYCAAYLSVLATAYGSFVPALSEHHAGGTNVGRVLVNGERLGGRSVQEKYLLGSRLARDLRAIPGTRYRPLVRSYGPRSARYTEMIFGNMPNVRALMDTVPATRIHAMRVSRPVPLDEVVRRSGLPRDEVRRFNPALVQRVPAGATLYLPEHVPELGEDVAFWRRPATDPFAELLEEFTRRSGFLEPGREGEAAARFEAFEERFRDLAAPEAQVMAAVLAYASEEWALPVRERILRDFRTSPRLEDLLAEGLREARTGRRWGPAGEVAYGPGPGAGWPHVD